MSRLPIPPANRVNLTQDILQEFSALHLSPPLQQLERTACSSASRSPEPQEPALRIELVPTNARVGANERFWLIHQASGLQVPGQFSRQEAEHILQATECWDWEIDYRPRTPRCSYQLFSLLSAVCTPQTLEVVA